MSRPRRRWRVPSGPPLSVRVVRMRGGVAVRKWDTVWSMGGGFGFRFICTWRSLLVNYGPLIDITGTPEGDEAESAYREYEAEWLRNRVPSPRFTTEAAGDITTDRV